MIVISGLLLFRLSVCFAFISFLPPKITRKTHSLHARYMDDATPIVQFNSSLQTYPYLYRYFPGVESISVIKTDSGEVSFVVNAILTGTPEIIWKYYLDKKNSEFLLSKAIVSNDNNVKNLFRKVVQFSDFDKTEILQLNSDFFRALANKDISTLRSIWLDSESSLCRLDHSKHLITSYKNIMAYFETISPSDDTTELIHVDLNFMGEVAIVSGRLLNYIGRKLKRPIPTDVTNIFVKSHVSGRYHLFSHFASRVQSVLPIQSLFRDPTVLPPVPRAPQSGNILDNIFGGMNLNIAENADHDIDASYDDDEEVDGHELKSSLWNSPGKDDGTNNDTDYDDDEDHSDTQDIHFRKENNRNLQSYDSISRRFDRGKRIIVPNQKNGFVVMTPMFSGKISPSKEHLQQIISDIFQNRNSPIIENNNFHDSDSHFRYFLENIRKGLDSLSKEKNVRISSSEPGSLKSLVTDADSKSETETHDADDENEDEDYEETDEVDVDEENYFATLEEKLQRERRLVTAASEALISWLELQHLENYQVSLGETMVNNDATTEFSLALTPTEASLLRTKLISAITKGTPSHLETIFAMFLCHRKPKYLGGKTIMVVENILRRKEHFDWFLKKHKEDLCDLVRMWKRIAADLLEEETKISEIISGTTE